MKRLKRVSLVAIVLLAAASVASAAVDRSAVAEVHGCWYTPPQAPGCHECSESCNSEIGQVCCRIVIE